MSFTATTSAQLGSTLRGLRKAAALTQTELAQRSGLQQKTISLLETAPQRCSVDSLMRYISAVEVVLTLQPTGRAQEPEQKHKDSW